MTNYLNPSSLLTDLYQLTMLQGYLDHNLNDTADFEFFVRDLPVNRNFLLAVGVEQVLEFLETLQFTSDELKWLASQGKFNKNFIAYLEKFKFEGDVHAMPEGTVFFPGEPILRITAPIPQAQLVETRIINLLHFQTMIASKAVRSVNAAGGKLLIDFGLRRSHGAEAGLLAARASYIAGYSGTSTVLAGKLFNIPLYGTMAHSFIQAHDDEQIAFENFAMSQPNNVVLLIDTYNILEAVNKVIRLSKKLKRKDIKIQAVRLDSGNLSENASKIRKILDQENLQDIEIFVSGNLDEYRLKEFADKKAPIDGFGVGTLMITSADAPYLECGYKLVHYAGTPRLKKSPNKVTWPSRKQVYRYADTNGIFAYDELTLEDESREMQPLLKLVMKKGERTAAPASLQNIRCYTGEQIKKLPQKLLQIDQSSSYQVITSDKLTKLVNNI